MQQKNKSRILNVLKLLMDKTDEQNPLSTEDIISYLASIGISAHRKTIALDVEQLIEFDIDVITIKSTQNKFFIGTRDFEIPEIKLLVDAVESSKFITPKKSADLVRKLSGLTSENQAKSLNRNIFIEKRVKPENEEIYYTVDTIHTAIAQEKQINFKYYDYTQAKKKVYKNKGFLYELSPYALSYSEDHYYVIGYCKKHNNISTFRVDRMVKIKMTDTTAVPMPENFNRADFTKYQFVMFDGERKTVQLLCTNELMNVIIDRFGEEVNTVILDSDHFKAFVDVAISSTFFGWVFQFSGKMEILTPEDVKQQYLEMKRK